MLKVNFTPSGCNLEPITTPLGEIIRQRKSLARSLGQNVHIQPIYASLLLNNYPDELTKLESFVKKQPELSLNKVDQDFVEITIQGIWISENEEAHNGVFILALEEPIQLLICNLWYGSLITT